MQILVWTAHKFFFGAQKTCTDSGVCGYNLSFLHKKIRLEKSVQVCLWNCTLTVYINFTGGGGGVHFRKIKRSASALPSWYCERQWKWMDENLNFLKKIAVFSILKPQNSWHSDATWFFLVAFFSSESQLKHIQFIAITIFNKIELPSCLYPNRIIFKGVVKAD